MQPDTEHRWLGDSLVMIMTMRADDAARWNPQRLVELAQAFSLGALGFSVGGITAFYPTSVPGHPRSPSLRDRDLELPEFPLKARYERDRVKAGRTED
jgi:hypothetical protein